MIKLFFTLTFVCVATLIFSQDYLDEEKYYAIILDGEPAYISIETGDVVKLNENNTTTNAVNTTITGSANNGSTHTIVKGDTFYSLSKRYKIEIKELAAINGMTLKTPLKIGQVLKLNTVATLPAVINGDSHTVIKGDTLYSISRKFGITVYELKQLNNLTSNALRVGQKINLR